MKQICIIIALVLLADPAYSAKCKIKTKKGIQVSTLFRGGTAKKDQVTFRYFKQDGKIQLESLLLLTGEYRKKTTEFLPETPMVFVSETDELSLSRLVVKPKALHSSAFCYSSWAAIS